MQKSPECLSGGIPNKQKVGDDHHHPSEVTIGSRGNHWRYCRTTKNFDLSPPPPKKFTFATKGNDEVVSVTIDPSLTALIIIDMQNFFLDPSCMEHETGLKAIEPTINVIKKCRELGIKIIWLNWGLTDEDLATMPTGVLHGVMKDALMGTAGPWIGYGEDLGGDKGRCLVAGTWNADVYPTLKEQFQDADIHCSKNRMSGLWTEEQPLWKILKRECLKTLMFTGVNTDQCVLGTLVDAYNAGWDCIAVEDCCGTPTVNGQQVSVANMAICYGFVTDSVSICGRNQNCHL